MNALYKTLRLYLTHSIVTLISIILLIILYIIALSFGPYPIKNGMVVDEIMAGVVNGFIGLYIGGAMMTLKQHPLWHYNPRYRHTLMTAFLILSLPVPIFTAIITTMQSQFSLTGFLLALFSYILSANVILERSFFNKFIAVIGLFFGYQISFIIDNDGFKIAGLVIGIPALLSYMLRYQQSPKACSQTKSNEVVLFSMVQNTSQPVFVEKINGFLTHFFSQSIKRCKGSLVWVLNRPSTRLPLTACLNLFIVTCLIVFNRAHQEIGIMITHIMLATMQIGVILESNKLFYQTRSIAHIFNADNHQLLKASMIRHTDKQLIFNNLIFYIGIMCLLSILGINENLLQLSLIAVAFFASALVIHPIIIMRQWQKVEFAIVAIVILYLGFALGLVYLVQQLTVDYWLSWPMLLIVSCFITIRYFTTYYFFKQDLENILR